MEENDDQVGVGTIDDRVVVNQPEPVDISQPDDPVRQFFSKLAGEDQEVDWMELKEILDYSMRNELPANRAADQGGTGGGEGVPGGGGGILSLICGAICGDSKIAESVLGGGASATAKGGETMNRGFSKDVCRSMVAMLDVDQSGTLGFEEFKMLWVDIRNWKAVFKLYDRDGSGCLNAFELRQALNSAGYRLNNHVLNILMHRYGTKEGTIAFDDFIMCAVKLKSMIDIFRERDAEGTNMAAFSMEEWVEKTLYS